MGGSYWRSNNHVVWVKTNSISHLMVRGPCIVIQYYNKTNQMHEFLKFIFRIKLYMFRTVPLSNIRSFFFHCTHSNGICPTGLLTACEQDQDGTAVGWNYRPKHAAVIEINNKIIIVASSWLFILFHHYHLGFATRQHILGVKSFPRTRLGVNTEFNSSRKVTLKKHKHNIAICTSTK